MDDFKDKKEQEYKNKADRIVNNMVGILMQAQQKIDRADLQKALKKRREQIAK